MGSLAVLVDEPREGNESIGLRWSLDFHLLGVHEGAAAALRGVYSRKSDPIVRESEHHQETAMLAYALGLRLFS